MVSFTATPFGWWVAITDSLSLSRADFIRSKHFSVKAWEGYFCDMLAAADFEATGIQFRELRPLEMNFVPENAISGISFMYTVITKMQMGHEIPSTWKEAYTKWIRTLGECQYGSDFDLYMDHGKIVLRGKGITRVVGTYDRTAARCTPKGGLSLLEAYFMLK